jgi:SAM-dependent methyltransferase
MSDQAPRTKILNRPCPVCGARSAEVLHRQRFVLAEGHLLPDSYDVVWCSRCGFAFADTPASEDVYDQYYADYSKYEDDRTSTGGGGTAADLRRLRETAALIADVLPDRNARILDVGCANGGLLGALKSLGYTRLTGMDPSPACAANVRRIHGIEGRTGSLRQIPEGMGTYDLVILSHVLEHVLELGRAVETLGSLLAPGGILYIEVPDASRYEGFLVAPFQDFNTEHINHFSPAALKTLFQSRGFSILSAGSSEIASDSGILYPAIHIFARKAAPATHEVVAAPDKSFRLGLLRYIELSSRVFDRIREHVSNEAGDRKVIVWGTGQLTMKLLAAGVLDPAKIEAFIDGNPICQNKRILGILVHPPARAADYPGRPILIGTLLHRQAIEKVIREELHLDNPVIPLESGGEPN